MQDKVLLKRSSDGLKAQVITIGVVALITALLSSWLLDKLLGWTPNEGQGVKVFAWVALLAIWAFATFKLWFEWKIKRYEIAQDSVVIHAKAGMFGTAQTVYRYESIISLRMTQGFLGKRFGYGDIHIAIPKIDDDIVMNDIENPIQQIAELQRRMNDRGTQTSALIN